jgi:hypothetical protein
MTVDTSGTTVAGPKYATRHLIHCPTSWEHYLLDAPSSGEENFVLAGSVPTGHPLFNDGPGHFHDAQSVTEEVREVGEFVGHRYFGVPRERPGLFYRFALDLTDLRAWRAGDGEPPRMTTRLTARPDHLIGGVPRGLTFGVEVRIDDVPACAGSAGLVFLTPALHRNHVEHSRRALRAAPELDDAPDGAGWPVDPAEIGRRAPGNVVVCEPAVSAQGRLTTWVLTRGDNPALAPSADGQVSGLLLLEALRQTSILTAGRASGVDADRAVVAGWDVHFRGYAQAGLPLRCVAVPGPLERDAEGRPAVPVTLTVTQHRRAVAEARTSVVQDL